MDHTKARRYFSGDDEILATEILRPLRAARSDQEIAEIVAVMNEEGREILGLGFRLRFDRTVLSRNVDRRVFLTRP